MSKNEVIPLQPPEFALLANKVNSYSIPVIFFRGNLFNATVRDSKDLERKKVFYEEGNNIYRTDRSLNQKHKDLFMLLMYADKTDIQPDGSFMVKISLYKMAKKLGYKYPAKDTEKVKKLLDDLSKTLIEVIDKDNKKRGFKFQILGKHYFDGDSYAVKITEDTAKYLTYSITVSIPKELGDKIIAIKEAKLKALITFMLANKKLENGIKLDTVCRKLLLSKYDRSRFKKQIKENTELLAEFGILYKDEKFFLKKTESRILSRPKR